MVNLLQYAINREYRAGWHFAREVRERIVDHPLTPDSIVIDCGAYKGEFARRIIDRHSCRNVVCFEPIPEFALAIPTTCAGAISQPRVLPFALGRANERRTFHISDDATGAFGSGRVVPVDVLDVADAFDRYGLAEADLLAINVEGGEYDILDRLIETGTIAGMKNVMVQFHKVVPDYEARYAAIATALGRTHARQWCFPWVWESWSRPWSPEGPSARS